MVLEGPTVYHPYAACLMFKGCSNGNTVQANLDAVVAYGRKRERTEHEIAVAIANAEPAATSE